MWRSGGVLSAEQPRAVNTLVLVHRKPLVDQWVERHSAFLGLDRRDIGVIGGGKRKPTGRIDVAMIQSLVRKGRVQDHVADYGHVIVDECHHVSAVSFERVLSEAKRSPLVLTERRNHLDLLADGLRPAARHLVVLHGGMKPRERRDALARLAEIPVTEERAVIATGRYIGEGFDDSRLDTLFLAMPIAWRGTLVQYAGRLHRRHAGKAKIRVYDYADGRVPVLAKMFAKRRRG